MKEFQNKIKMSKIALFMKSLFGIKWIYVIHFLLWSSVVFGAAYAGMYFGYIKAMSDSSRLIHEFHEDWKKEILEEVEKSNPIKPRADQ